jgi:hypothetical protein
VKRSPKPGDEYQRAWAVLQEATGQATPDVTHAKDPAAVARGRAGGIARAKNLTSERRREIALVARTARGTASKP